METLRSLLACWPVTLMAAHDPRRLARQASVVLFFIAPLTTHVIVSSSSGQHAEELHPHVFTPTRTG